MDNENPQEAPRGGLNKPGKLGLQRAADHHCKLGLPALHRLREASGNKWATDRQLRSLTNPLSRRPPNHRAASRHRIHRLPPTDRRTPRFLSGRAPREVVKLPGRSTRSRPSSSRPHRPFNSGCTVPGLACASGTPPPLTQQLHLPP